MGPLAPAVVGVSPLHEREIAVAVEHERGPFPRRCGQVVPEGPVDNPGQVVIARGTEQLKIDQFQEILKLTSQLGNLGISKPILESFIQEAQQGRVNWTSLKRVSTNTEVLEIINKGIVSDKKINRLPFEIVDQLGFVELTLRIVGNEGLPKEIYP